jgi:NADP-dependent 3-hydroxy acid dehydrogenase YdfG
MKDLSGKVAAITGAASGIGRALALNLAAEGCHVAIADVDSQGLEETARMLAGRSDKATTHIVDVSDRQRVYQWAEEVLAQHSKVNILINNAGVALIDTIIDGSLDDFEWLFGINFWGVVFGTKAFLPHLLESGDGHIVNISSIGGFFSTPNFGAYGASKYAVRGFTETLFQELNGSCVGVTCVHPGGISTNLARNVRFGKSSQFDRDQLIKRVEKLLKTTPDRTAKRVVNAIRKRKPRLMVGLDAYLIYTLGRIFPVQMMKVFRHLGGGKYLEGAKIGHAQSPGLKR